MNIIEAKKVIKWFSHEWDEERQLQTQMPDLASKLTLTWNERGFYSSESLKGRVITWLRGKESKRGQERKVLEVANRAIKTLHESGVEKLALSPQRCIALKRLIAETLPIEEKSSLNHSHLDTFESELEQKAEERRVERGKIEAKSLLNPLRHKRANAAIDDDTFAELLGEKKLSLKGLDRIHEYLLETIPLNQLNRNPSLDRFHRWMYAFRATKAAEMKMVREEKLLSTEERLAERQRHAQKITERVQALNPGEKTLFIGSYGTKFKNLKMLFEVFDRLPTDILKSLPPSAKNVMQDPRAQDPEEFVKKTLHEQIHSMTENLPFDEKNFLSFLFSDPERELNPRLQAALPTFFADPIQRIMAKGVLGNLAHLSELAPSNEVLEMLQFASQICADQAMESPGLAMMMLSMINLFPSDTTREVLKWIATHGKAFSQADKREELLQELENFLLSKAKEPLEDLFQPLIEGFQKQLRSIPDYVPQFLLQVANVEHLLQQGDLWVEMEKQPDGKYTVYVYGDKDCAPPVQSASRQHFWPLIIKNVDEEKLNDDFFGALLNHHIETSITTKLVSTPKILMEEIIGTLGEPTTDLNQAQILPKEALGTNQTTHFYRYVFEGNPVEVKKKALIDYCSKHLKEGSLNLQDQNRACELLEVAVKQLRQECTALTDAEEATLKEIEWALEDQANVPAPMDTPFTLLDPSEDADLFSQALAEMMHSCGLSVGLIRDFRAPLGWALGEDVMGLLDIATDSLEKFPPGKRQFIPANILESSSIRPHVKGKGWLREFVTRAYVQVLFRALQLGYGFYRISSPVLALFLLLPNVLKLMPLPFQEWYHKVKRIALKAAAELLTTCILRLVLSQEGITMLKSWREGANMKAKAIREVRPLNFEITTPPEKQEPKQVTTTPIEPTETPQITEKKDLSDVIYELLPHQPKGPITDETLLPYLQEIVQKKEGLDDTLRGEYLSRALIQLPIPTGDSDCFWKKIKNPKKIMNLLHELGLSLPHKSESDEQFTRTVLASYTLLFIMEALAIQNPETLLRNLRVNAYPFKAWSLSGKCTLKTHEEIECFEGLQNYYAKHPSDKDQGGLFHFSYLSDLNNPKTTHISPDEKKYLEALFKDLCDGEDIRSVLSLYMTEDFSEYALSHQEKGDHRTQWLNAFLTKGTLDTIMAWMSATTVDHKTPVPRFYRLLRQQAHITNVLVLNESIELPLKNEEIPTWTWQVEPMSWSEYLNPNNGHSLVKMWKKGGKIIQLEGANDYNPTNQTFNPDLVTKRHSYSILAKAAKLNPTQSQILSNAQKYNTLVNHSLQNAKTRHESSMMFTHSEDRIPRLIAHYRKNKRRYPKVHIISRIKTILFHASHLKTLLQQSPDFSRVLGEFFLELLEDNEYKKHEVILSLAISAYRFCQRYSLHKGNDFPELTPYIEASNIPHHFALIYGGLPRVDMEPNQKKKLAKQAILARNYNSKFVPNSIKWQFEALFTEWIPEISHFMKSNSSFCDEVGQKNTIENPLNTIPQKPTLSNDSPIISTREISSKDCPGLQPLARFCDVNNIAAFANKEGSLLTKFTINPYDLHFDIKEVNGEKRALNQGLFPDYFIDPKQDHLLTRKFGAYLLLRNREGKYKVIIPDGQWMGALAWNGLSHVAPLAHLAGPFLRKHSYASSSKAYAFDLDDQGHLKSEDPEALLYLLSLYLLQRDTQAANRLCEQLEAIAKRSAIDPKCLDQLIPLTFAPNMFKDAQTIRIRLTAAFEQNSCIPFTDENLKQKEQEHSAWHRVMTIRGVIDDLYALQQMTPHEKKSISGGGITDDREWYLYKTLIRQSISMLQGSNQIHQKLKWVGEKLGWLALFEQLILPPDLSQRYEALKKKYGILESTKSKFLRVGIQTLKSSESPKWGNLDPMRLLPGSKAIDSALSIQQECATLVQSSYAAAFQTPDALQIRQVLLERDSQPIMAPMKGSELTEIDFAHHFLDYYPLARGEKGEEEQKAFIRMLALYQGKRTGQVEYMIDLLKTVANYPRLFPTSDSLKEQLRLGPQLPKLVSTPSALEISKKPINKALTKANMLKNLGALYQMARNKDPNFLNHLPFLKSMVKLEENTVHATNVKICASYLMEVYENPMIFPETDAFISLFNRACEGVDVFSIFSSYIGKETPDFTEEWQYRPWVDAWNTLVSRHNHCNTLSPIVHGMGKLYLRAQKYSTTSTFTSNLLSGVLGSWSYPVVFGIQNVLPSLSTAYQIWNADPVETEQSPSLVEKEPKNTQLYAPLDALDGEIDKQLDALFSQTFDLIVKDENNDSHRVQPLSLSDATNEEQSRFERVNRDVDAYYNRPEGPSTQVKLKNEKALFALYTQLVDTIRPWKEGLKKEVEKLVSLIQTKNGPIPFKALLRLFLKGDFKHLGENLQVDAETLQSLDIAIAAHVASCSRLQQFERIVSHIEALIHIDPIAMRDCYHEKIEKVADELRARRSYRFESIKSTRLSRRFMLFEFLSNKLIWPKQYERIENLLLSKDKDICLELLMSFGKTVFGVPTIDSFEADGKQLVCNIWPSAMNKTNTRQISQQSLELFDQIAHSLSISRSMELTPGLLQNLSILFQSVAERGETMNMTREDAQALELLLLDTLYHMSEGKGNADSSEVAMGLQKLLHHLRFSARAVGDEAHELFDCRQELNYPVGPKEKISDDYYEVIEEVMLWLFKDEKVRRAIKQNKTVELTEKQKSNATEKVARTFAPDDEEVVDYLCGRAEFVPQAVKESENWEHLALVKGCLSILLPKAFEENIMVDHGPSDINGDGKFSRPYGGNMSPENESLFRIPYISLVRTFLRFFHSGITQEEAESVVKDLKKSAEEEVEKLGLAIDETPSWRLFKELCAKIPKKTFDEGSAQEIAENLTRHPRAISYFIKHFVKDEILYWKLNLSSNVQNFASMFASQYHDTGTPYNDGTYPGNVKMLWDPGTIGEALHTIEQKCPADGVHQLEKNEPTEILDEVLSTYFKAGSEFTALIDGSALLKGLSNEDVATRMMKYIGMHRKDLKGVAYFKKDEKGKDQLVVWEIGAKAPVPIDRSGLKPEERLSYYDQRHGFAADIPQKKNAKALDLVGPKVTLFRLLQEVYRMRGLKTWKKLVGIGEEDFTGEPDQTQSIHFAMTKKTKEMLSKEASPTLRDIICFAIQNEAKQAAMDNYFSYRQKVMDTARRHVLDKILQAKSANQMRSLFIKHSSLLLVQVEDDPIKLFGLITTKQELDNALNAIRKEALESFRGQEREAVAKKIDSIEKHPMPKEVETLDLDAAVTVHAEQNSQDEDQQQQQQQQEQQNQNTVMNLSSSARSYQEMEWDPEFVAQNPHQWLHMSNPNNIDASTIMTPPLFKVQDLLKSSSERSLQAVANSFDGRLWMSNNLLPAYMGRWRKGAEIGGLEQRPIHHLLIWTNNDPVNPKIHSMGAISHKDAFFWRHFIGHRNAKTLWPFKGSLILFDQELGWVTDSTKPLNRITLTQSDDFQSLLHQFKFLNGESIYKEASLPHLKTWISTHSPHALKRAFDPIFRTQGDQKYFRSTTLDFIFRELTPAVQV